MEILPPVPLPVTGFSVSVTISENVSEPVVAGVVKVGFCAVGIRQRHRGSGRLGPRVGDGRAPWAWVLAEPSSVTVRLVPLLWAAPALATGRVYTVLAYAARAAEADALPVLVLVTMTLNVGQLVAAGRSCTRRRRSSG